VKLSLYRPWMPIWLGDVEDATTHKWRLGCQPYAPGAPLPSNVPRLSANMSRYDATRCECNEAVRQPFLDLKKAYDSVRREVLRNLLVEFRVPMKLVRLGR
jgi:hypothetical protein